MVEIQKVCIAKGKEYCRKTGVCEPDKEVKPLEVTTPAVLLGIGLTLGLLILLLGSDDTHFNTLFQDYQSYEYILIYNILQNQNLRNFVQKNLSSTISDVLPYSSGIFEILFLSY